MRLGLAYVFAAAAWLLTACTQAWADVPCEIRVVLSDDKQSVQIGGALEWRGGSSDVCTSGEAVEVRRVDQQVKVVIGDKGVQAQRLVATPATGYVRYGGRDYRGRLEFFVGKDGGVIVLNVLPLEDYLYGVVPSEMPSKWPQAALQAQAVAARTYAVSRMLDQKDESFDVYSTVADQAYLGVSGESASGTKAVDATAGQVVTYNGKPIVAMYCSDAGGCTKCGTQPYLKAVPIESPESPNYQWAIPIDRARLGKLAEKKGATVGTVQSISTQQDPQSGHLVKLVVTGNKGTAEIGGNTLRSLLGLNVMKSTRAWVEIVGQPVPKLAKASKVAGKQPPPKQKKLVDKSSGDVVEIGGDKSAASADDDDDDDGMTLLAPFARPYIALGDGIADRKLRTAYASDGETVVDCAKDVFVASGPILAAAVAPVADTALKLVQVKKTTPMVKTNEDLPAVSGAVGPEGIIIHGSGYGHGVGMSQWGAKTLADRGYSYDQILTYFYSGVQLADIPQSLGGRGRVIPAVKKTTKAADVDSDNEAVEIGAAKFAPGR